MKSSTDKLPPPPTPPQAGGESAVRVRIPPSPTGNLHVGTARTALFNELFARKAGGAVVLRFEDTDRERSKKEFEDNITDGLAWLGISYDEGPFRQSERTASYTKALEQLLASDKAYKDGEAILLRVQPERITFHDEIRGDVSVHTDSFEGDFVIARSITNPLYHLAVVVDDHDMRITHVIRGEDHLHNTIKHILLQRALGYRQPIYAHLPLLLDTDRKKLSKRSGETSVLAYRDMGFLPQAMVNYLALLGWNNGDDQEFYTHDELIAVFSLGRVQKSGAIFSMQKLSAMNKQYLLQLSDDELLAWALIHYRQQGIEAVHPDRLLGALRTELGRFSSYDVGGTPLHEAMSWHQADWKPSYDPGLLVWKKSTKSDTKQILADLLAFLKTIPAEDFSVDTIKQRIMDWIDASKRGRGDTLWPMRIALSGREHSPGPFEIASVIGKEDTTRRLAAAHAIL